MQIQEQIDIGNLTVHACFDQNADGLCATETELTGGVEACLEDSSGSLLGCLPAPAAFTDLTAGTYTTYLQFTAEAAGHYPTTGRVAVDLSPEEEATATLGAVYPIHPTGVAVQPDSNKVYAAFQGPNINNTWPYPFVAVIDGNTDEVLYTIPGGTDGIGRQPWGVAVSGNNVYVGSYGEGRISIIDATIDEVIANIKPNRSDFQPAAAAVNPANGQVHFTDYRGRRVVILDGETIAADLSLRLLPDSFRPLEVAVTDNGRQGHSFVTMRDPTHSNSVTLAEVEAEAVEPGLTSVLPPPLSLNSSHAIGLWPQLSESRLFVTYATDPAGTRLPLPNPNRLAIYSFSANNPQNILPQKDNIRLGDYAEAGLVYDSELGRMLGAYGGFAYDNNSGDATACSPGSRGGIYEVDFEGNLSEGPTPAIVVGNPPLVSNDLDWKNPFELALNPNTGKLYVTDRCWNDFPQGGQPGGAVLVIQEEGGQPTPTPTITPTATITSTITPTPTITPTTTPTTSQMSLVMTGPASVNAGDTFSVTVQALNVPDPGLYGVQFTISFDPNLISVANLQVNPDLSFVLIEEPDNVAGQLTLVASRQGPLAGLSGEVTLLTFEATALTAEVEAAVSASATFSFEEAKIGDPQANAFEFVSQDYTVLIEGLGTPTPTDEPTPTPTDEPTAEPTDEPTPTPTDEPTAEPTDEPTPTPTDEPTAEPTDEPTPTPTDEPTAEPTAATVSGQVILAGRANNDWSGASVTVDDSGQNGTTNLDGYFSLAAVPVGSHSSITADAEGYLSAVCLAPSVTAPETTLLAVTLVSGDINGDEVVDIADATEIGVNFGATGPALAADINRDEVVDIFDLIPVGVNFGEVGPQAWVCQ
jgi:hypothetical protein